EIYSVLFPAQNDSPAVVIGVTGGTNAAASQITPIGSAEAAVSPVGTPEATVTPSATPTPSPTPQLSRQEIILNSLGAWISTAIESDRYVYRNIYPERHLLFEPDKRAFM